MTNQNLKKAVDVLFTEKSRIDKQMTEINDRRTRFATELQEKRAEQFGYREAKESLPNMELHKPARKVLDDEAFRCQSRIDQLLKELDQVEKDALVWGSKSRAIEKSIKELQNS
jgi:hypothetical protein